MIENISGNSLVFDQLLLPSHLLPVTSHTFEITTHKYNLLARAGRYSYPSSNSASYKNTKCWGLVSEVGISISQRVSAVPGCFFMSQGDKGVCRQIHGKQIFFKGLLSVWHQSLHSPPVSFIPHVAPPHLLLTSYPPVRSSHTGLKTNKGFV